MKQKLTAFILCACLVLSAAFPAFGLEKSIQPVSTDTSIDNAGRSVSINYEGEDARVYYGSGGIFIITTEKEVHISTNFAVKQLEAIGDVNKDGYTDFFTYQNAPDYTEQLIAISGKDGSVISALSLTRQGYDSSIGYVQTNSYIQQLFAAEDCNVMVIYDYSIVKIDPTTGNIIWEQSFDNNLWRIISIGDMNFDGSEDFAVSGQSNLIALISGADGEVIKEWHPCEDRIISPPWNDSISVKAVMNIWDLYFDGEFIYATSEDGCIFTLNPHFSEQQGADRTANPVSESYESISRTEIGVLSNDDLNENLYSYNIDYNGVGYRYLETGVVDWPYMGYRFADAKDGYLLINCFMGAADSAAGYSDSSWPATTVLFNTMTGEIEQKIQHNYSDSMYQKTCFIDYEGMPCVAVINSLREKAVSIAYYDFTGSIVYQREAELNMIDYNSRYELSEDNGLLRAEVFSAGCAVFSEDLKTTSYEFSKTSTALLSANQDGIYVLTSENGTKVKVARYDSDMSKELWSYSTTDEYANKGFEFIRSDRDYDADGTPDVMAIVNELDEENNPAASWYIILSGEDGSEILNTKIQTDRYWDYEKGKLVTVYHTSSTIDMLTDLDYDSKPELLCGTSVISSRWMNVIGELYGGINAQGNQLQIGDVNKDGMPDYLVVSETETRLYQSSIGFSWGYVQLNYVKTNIAFANDKTLEPQYNAGLIGDITRDGVSELVMPAKNPSGFEMFSVYNGATLEHMYDLCDYGLNDDGESFAALDIDFNGDGFNELYGRDNWRYGIYDGQTGALVYDTSGENDYWLDGGYFISVMTTSSAMESDKVVYTDPSEGFDSGYHPDYTLGFFKLDEKPNFIVLKDANGDGNPDIAFIRSGWDENTGERMSNLLIAAGGSFELIDSIKLSMDDIYASYSIGDLINIENSDNYAAVKIEQKLSIIDLTLRKVLASFDINTQTAMQQSEGSIIISAADGNLYKLNLEKGFELKGQLPETTDDYTLNIAWDPLQAQSVMTITDNDQVVYKGNATSCDVHLLAGTHNLKFTMNDGQGKTYSETHTVEVAPQQANYTWVIVVFAAALLLALFFGIVRKARIAGVFRRAAK